MIENGLAWLATPALQPLIGAVLALVVSSTVARWSERKKARDTWLASILSESAKYRSSLAMQELVNTMNEIAGDGEESTAKEARARARIYKVATDAGDPNKGSAWSSACIASH